MSARILIVDDDPHIRSSLKQRIERGGRHILTAMDGAEALSVIRQEHPSLVLLDLELPGMSGIEVLQRLRKESELRDQEGCQTAEGHAMSPSVIMLTAFGTVHRAVESMKLGACGLASPCSSATGGASSAKHIARHQVSGARRTSIAATKRAERQSIMWFCKRIIFRYGAGTLA